MAVIREISRNGALPEGVVDGHCLNCQADVLVGPPDYRCPDCDAPVHPDSLPRQARIAALEAQSEAKPDETAPRSIRPSSVPVRAAEGQPKTVTLRRSRAALAWDRATDDLVAEAEREEREAEAAYLQARARYDAARQEAHRIRQLRQLVRVASATAPPPPPAQTTTGKRWSRKHNACVNCGETRIRHASLGRCMTCDSYWRARGEERPIKETEHGD